MADTQDAAVKTYVSPEEKAEWKAQADQFDMSLAEFVREMVQAGRRNFEVEPVRVRSDAVNPQGQPLEQRVLQTLRNADYPSWRDIAGEYPDVDEDRLDTVLSELQSENRIEHAPRHGGYSVLEDE